MPRFKLLLREDKKDAYGLCPVFMHFSHKGKRAERYTNIKIKPSDVSRPKTGKAPLRIKNKDEHTRELNNTFEILEHKAADVVRRFVNSKEPFTASQLADAFTGIQSGENTPWDKAFEWYIEELRKQGMKQGTLSTRQTTKASLAKYIGMTRMYTSNFTPEFVNAYVEWLFVERKAEPGTAKELFGHVIRYLRYLNEAGFKVPTATLTMKPERKFNVRVKKAIFLTLEEFDLFYSYQPKTEYEELAKDIFILLCASGVRVSDANINKGEDYGDRVVKSMQKTDRNAVIVKSDILTEILEKHNYNIPRIGTPELNRLIKLIAKNVGINAPVKVISYPGGVKHEKVVPKWQTLSSKVGRKTMVSNLLAAGVDVPVIKLITGHSKDFDIAPYAGVVDTQLDDPVKQLFKKRKK